MTCSESAGKAIVNEFEYQTCKWRFSEYPNETGQSKTLVYKN